MRPTRVRRLHRVACATVAASLALGLVAACGPGNGAIWQGGGGGGQSATPVGPDELTVSITAGAKDVSPVTPIKVDFTGTLTAVTLTNSTGKVVKGAITEDLHTWQNGEVLGYNRSYTLVVAATGTDGQPLTKRYTFSTVKPKNLTLPYLRNGFGGLGTGATYGVGQPIIVWFDEPIKDRKAAEQQLIVVADPPVSGAWHWFGNREAHWRPEKYWPSGTKVTIDAMVYGHDLGDGLYGQEDVHGSFTVGASHVAIADDTTHHMKIYINGVLQTSIGGKSYPYGVPISMGRGGQTTTPDGTILDFHTNSGPHFVLDKQPSVKMSSASFGLTDPSNKYYYPPVDVKLAVRISAGGEFVHSAPWSVWAQGHSDQSHGCINVSPSVAQWFYDTFIHGDVVDVRNTGRMLGDRPSPDGPVDWVISWSDWLKGSMLGEQLAGTPAVTPTPDPSASPTPGASLTPSASLSSS
jgi:lipoprotein-anchoring transpeptidase ErfK/SrfK